MRALESLLLLADRTRLLVMRVTLCAAATDCEWKRVCAALTGGVLFCFVIVKGCVCRAAQSHTESGGVDRERCE